MSKSCIEKIQMGDTLIVSEDNWIPFHRNERKLNYTVVIVGEYYNSLNHYYLLATNEFGIYPYNNISFTKEIYYTSVSKKFKYFALVDLSHIKIHKIIKTKC